MGLVLGMDEAGYGPNLGPLVIGVTAWRVPESPRTFDLWQVLSQFVSQGAPRLSTEIQVADSKVVFRAGKGLELLEESVLSLLAACGHAPRSLRELISLATGDADWWKSEPWYSEEDLALPHAVSAERLEMLSEVVRAGLDATNVRFDSWACQFIQGERFNTLVDQYGTKGFALSRSSMQLLARVWQPDSSVSTWIIADKHGGRNQYHELLSDIAGDMFVVTAGEGRDRSHYRIGNTEITFRVGAEAEFPVAVSSMICKYLRELAMVLFNRYWQRHVPGLRHTAGYPVDAARFRDAVSTARKELGVPDRVFWRAR